VTEWLNDRFGKQRPAPTEPGTQGLPALADAPGTYVYDS
jgi:poly(3-hydroxyalkanoate) synthetase